MSIPIIDQLSPLGDFPAVDASDVQAGSERLSARLSNTPTTAQVDAIVANKVDKVPGKGLSANDYTTTEKDKLAGIEAQANKTVVDNALSSSSTNPVQNKIVTAKIGELESEIDILKTFVTPEEFGAVADGLTDCANAFYSMFDYMIQNNINIAKLGVGKYCTSKSLAIPSNVTLEGSGYESFIYLTDGTNLGVALTNGGSNIVINNLRVGNINDTSAISSSGYGAIGLSNYTYDAVKNNTLNETEDVTNIKVTRIYATGSYPVQIEPHSSNSIANIIISDIYAPKGLVSCTNTNNSHLTNVNITNVDCDVLRIGYNANARVENINVDNIVTSFLRLSIDAGDTTGININNVLVDTKSELYTKAFNSNSAVFVNGDLCLRNISIINNSTVEYGIYIYAGNTIFDNVKILNDFETKNTETNGLLLQTLINCDFGTKVSTIMGRSYNSEVTLVGGSAGLPKFYDDTHEYGVVPTSAFPEATGSIQSKISRFNTECKVLAYLANLTLVEGTVLLSHNNDAYFPKSDRYITAKAYDYETPNNSYNVLLKVTTDGKIEVSNLLVVAGVQSLSINRLLIDGSYYI